MRAKIIWTLFLLFFARMAFSAEPIQIGISGPFSGPYVAQGDQQWYGALQAVDDINAEGGINGRPLKLVPADDACDAKKAEKIANEFVHSGKIAAVIGHNCSSATMAASRIYGQAGMVMITPASTKSEITEQGYASIFRTSGRDDDQGHLAADFITHKLKAKRVAILHDGSVYGLSLAQSTRRALTELGNPPVWFQEINDSDKLHAELAATFAKIKPDLIHYSGLHTDAGHLLKRLRGRDDNTPFFSGDGIASPDFIQAAGGDDIVEGVYMTFFKNPKGSEAKKFIDKMLNKRITPTGNSLNAYAAVQAIAAGLRALPGGDKKLADWLHRQRIPSIIGELSWDAKGDLKGEQFIIYQWNGEGEYAPY